FLRWLDVRNEPLGRRESPLLVGRQTPPVSGHVREPFGIGCGIQIAHAGHGPVIRAAAIGRTACALRDALAAIGERDLIAHDSKWAPDRDRLARSPGGSPALKELPGADMLERAGPHRNCFGRGDCKGIAVSPGRYSAKESGRGTCE